MSFARAIVTARGASAGPWWPPATQRFAAGLEQRGLRPVSLEMSEFRKNGRRFELPVAALLKRAVAPPA